VFAWRQNCQCPIQIGCGKVCLARDTTQTARDSFTVRATINPDEGASNE
jgi:hypothetical protein